MGKYGGGISIVRAVFHLQGFVQGFGANNGNNRTKYFFFGHGHIGSYIINNGGTHVKSAFFSGHGGSPAIDQDFRAGLFGFVENDLGFKIIFGLPGIILASIFVTVPFVIREVEPVLHELGTEQEEAAATLGSTWWQTFWRITLPSIRWGLTYGIVLTVARTLGEFGAVLMVSSNLPGESQTLTLLVSDRYNRGVEYGAYALSTLLMMVAVLVLVVQVVLDARRSRT